MHILLVYRSAYPDTKGGVDTLLAHLIAALPPEVRVTLLIPGEWPVATWQQWQHGPVTLLCKRLRLPHDPQRPLRGWLGGLWEFPRTLMFLRNYCRQQRVDVVHLFTVQRHHLYFRWLHRLGGPPYLVTGVGSDFLKFSRTAPGLTAVLENAARLTAVAPHVAQSLHRHLPHLPPPQVIPNGIDAVALLNLAATANPLPMTVPERFFVLVGDIDRGKGQDVAIRAWGQLRHRLPDLHLLIIGVIPVIPETRDYHQALQHLLEQQGCRHRVQIFTTLARPVMLALAQRSLGLILPTRGEGLPYVLLESGVLALPTLFSAIPPFTELLTDGLHTLLVPPDDPAALADAVQRLANDTTLAAHLAKNLHQLVTRQWTAQAMARDYLAVYREIAPGANHAIMVQTPVRNPHGRQ